VESSIRRALVAMAWLSTALLLPGCANEVASPVAGQALLVPGQGVVLGSLVLDFGGSSPELRKAVIAQSSVTVVVRRVGGGISDEMSFSTSNAARSTPGLERFTDTDRRLLFFRSLPPGEYVIARREGHLLNSTFNSREGDQGTRFTVRAGQVTYIGAEIVTSYAKHDWLGVTSPGTTGLALSDDVDDDSRHFYHLHPELRSLPFDDALRGGAR
jgi:hypothetical protein